jgi:hypothetical protein
MSSERLRKFFNWTTRRTFRDLGIQNNEVVYYIIDFLTFFARTENLYRLKNVFGQPLKTVVDILLEANLQRGGKSEARLEREREMRRHVGDYTLFMTGLFREYVEAHSFLDFYLREGRGAYQDVFELDQILYRPKSLLYHDLSRNFEFYSGALTYMRKTFFREGRDPFEKLSPDVGQMN